MVNGSKMKKWKMSISTWERNQKKTNVIYVNKIGEYTDDELTKELKKRGYTGGLKKEILLEI